MMRPAFPLGIVTLVLALLAGLWLMYVPFAAGYQTPGQPWVLATRNDLVVAILVIGLAIAGITGYLSMALAEALQAAKRRRAETPAAEARVS